MTDKHHAHKIKLCFIFVIYTKYPGEYNVKIMVALGVQMKKEMHYYHWQYPFFLCLTKKNRETKFWCLMQLQQLLLIKIALQWIIIKKWFSP